MGIKVVTDSTAYIPEELLKKYDIRVVSLGVIMGDESCRELDIDKETFYEKMESSGKIPTSSQPTLDEVTNVFKRILDNGDDIVAIFISSNMSGTYSSAHIVKDILDEEYIDRRIEIVDSRSNCMQMGYSAIVAAKEAQKGANMDKVLEACNNVIKKSRFLFTPDNLTYLRKGGRIGGASALVGSILQIRPILTVENGVTTVFEKVRTKKKAVNKIIETVLKDIENNGLGDIIVHHINCEEEGRDIAKRLSDKLNINVNVTSIGPVIGLHVGPGAVGVAYYTKK